MTSVFRKVMVIHRLPDKSGVYVTNRGAMQFTEPYDRWYGLDPQWWLEEVTLPTEEEIQEAMDNLEDDDNDSANDEWLNGVNFILDKLKGGAK